ncbi:phosphotransferase family protein, partial [Halobacillus sp. BBL2006]|uniref:phosphotransferase family protein n=1 Tax=Halobacillus sp. BBL2006 TaxID=1543706 RepID=UPI0005426FC7
MKENWERVKSSILLEDQEIQFAVEKWKPDLSIQRIEVLSGGLSHTNYKITFMKEEPIVLRVSESEENLRMEKTLHDHLHKYKKVPLFHKLISLKEYKAGILQWKQGRTLKDMLYEGTPSVSGKLGYSAGLELANIRQYPFEKSGFFDQHLDVVEPFEMTQERYLETMEMFLGPHISRWIEKEMIDQIRDFAKKWSELISLDDSSSALVHADYNGLNLLGDEEGITAVLDWEFAMAGSIYWDIGNFIRYPNTPNFSYCEKGFIAGLKSQGIILPKEWKQIARLYDLLGL